MSAPTKLKSPSLENWLTNLGREIKDVRKGMRLSAQLVADTAGVSRLTVLRIEAGNPGTSMIALVAVMRSLGITQFPILDFLPHSSEDVVVLENYPGLWQVAWQVDKRIPIPKELLWGMIRTNHLSIAPASLGPKEWELINELEGLFGRLPAQIRAESPPTHK